MGWCLNERRLCIRLLQFHLSRVFQNYGSAGCTNERWAVENDGFTRHQYIIIMKAPDYTWSGMCKSAMWVATKIWSTFCSLNRGPLNRIQILHTYTRCNTQDRIYLFHPCLGLRGPSYCHHPWAAQEGSWRYICSSEYSSPVGAVKSSYLPRWNVTPILAANY